MTPLSEAMENLHLDSAGEEDRSDDGPQSFVRRGREIPSDSEDENDPDDYGYYDGTNRFYIRLSGPRVKLPRWSLTIPGAMDVFSQERDFTLEPRQSAVVRVGFGLFVPEKHLAVFTSREGLARSTGVTCFETLFGPGVKDDIKLRIYNSSRYPWRIEKGTPVALLLTRRAQIADFEFQREDESESDDE